MNKEKVLLAFTGDVMLGRGVNEAIRKRGPAYPWGDTLGTLKSADARLINLECVIAESGSPWAGTPKTFFFRADPLAVKTLQAAEIDFVSLANNHTLDFEAAALIETLNRLDGAGIARAGAGRDNIEASRPAILDVKGLRIAVFAITDNEPEWLATAESPGVNYMAISADSDQCEALAVRVRQAKAVCDLVVLTAHWGPNMVSEPPADFRRFARALVDAGADIFHGHSAHIFQGVESYRGGLILYDTGDFVDDYVVDPWLRNDLSFLFLVKVMNSRVVELELVPMHIQEYQVNLAVGRAADLAINKMERLCREMDTGVERTDRGIAIGSLGRPGKEARGRS